MAYTPKHGNSDRLHLTSREMDQLITAAKGSRNEARDRCLLVLAFRHGLRVSEACHLSWIRWTSTAGSCTSTG
jgi:site-specific recombinase XerD